MLAAGQVIELVAEVPVAAVREEAGRLSMKRSWKANLPPSSSSNVARICLAGRDDAKMGMGIAKVVRSPYPAFTARLSTTDRMCTRLSFSLN